MIHLTCSISDPDLRYEWLKIEEIKPVAKVTTEQEDQNYGAIKKVQHFAVVLCIPFMVYHITTNFRFWGILVEKSFFVNFSPH